ncbi:hypothetical protein VD0002_g3410 [Verticillium dahliae]|uniref:Mei5 protein n=2 Tax=Verticillium dahliae TaxID=27337 RepID=G2WSI4_VERDV|nr:uncharacterized protein VDAG_00815 [Verticillium dahliae VdLs.17]KAF3343208.1 hypothetical protein VdG2_08638 [Verticillium dahliae VDG2]KAH6701780.1 hypothetical protein EV126DRAFT_242128 [Verticillium dahliae]EGY17133.1 hypothetical protein VDAG_00815 [Verticillium dahliae VdLs.17]PNH32469.1 hypothetical protein BJF96_g4146 [Verticillium dahliae]PNH50483.1 hypothetical protein VD0003_g6687 [Verticillium dahliae]
MAKTASPDEVLGTLIQSIKAIVSNDGTEVVESFLSQKRELERSNENLHITLEEITKKSAQLYARIDASDELVEQKKGELEQLAAANAALKADLAGAVKAAAAAKTQLAEKGRSCAEAESRVRSMNKTIEGMKSSLEKERVNTAAAKALEAKAKGELHATQAKLNSAAESLKRIEHYTTPLVAFNREEAITKLRTISELSRSLAVAHVGIDLDDAVLSDPENWTGLKTQDEKKNLSIPLPRSNTPAAKLMRVASFLAVLSRQLELYIFQPTYFMTESSELSGLILDMKDKQQASHLRSVLLRASPDEHGEAQARRAVDGVYKCVKPLLRQRDSLSFRASLEKVCREISEMWETFQRYTLLVTADLEFHPDYPDDWKSFPSIVPPANEIQRAPNRQAVQPNGAISRESIPVWPTFITTQHDGAIDVVLQGTVITEHQMKDAKVEEQKQMNKEMQGSKRLYRGGRPRLGSRAQEMNGTRSDNEAPFLSRGAGDGSRDA